MDRLAKREALAQWAQAVKDAPGYELAQLPDVPGWDGPQAIVAALCERCGAFVFHIAKHDAFHEEVGR